MSKVLEYLQLCLGLLLPLITFGLLPLLSTGGVRMSKVLELILNNLQLCLGVWQFIKITPIGPLIKGVVSWLLRPFGLSGTYCTLQTFDGRVLKKVNCFVLQSEISFARSWGVELGREKLLVKYLGKEFLLERRGNMLFVNGNMCYCITPTVWEELQVLENITHFHNSVQRAINTGAAVDTPLLPRNRDADRHFGGDPHARHVAGDIFCGSIKDVWSTLRTARVAIGAAADAVRAAPNAQEAARVASLASARVAHDAVHGFDRDAHDDHDAALASSEYFAFIRSVKDTMDILRDAGTVARAARAAADPDEAADPAKPPTLRNRRPRRNSRPRETADPDDTTLRFRHYDTVLSRHYGSVVLKGHREFWEEVSTGGIMSFDEVLDGLILHNQHLSLPLAEKWLLPVSVSEETLLMILNLFAMILQTKKEKVHWLIPISLSFILALLEFCTPLRVWLYTIINVLFCSIMHSMCDLLPRPWRRQVYSLGKWVENLKPTNDIQLKIQRRNIRAIIAGGTKIDRPEVPVASLAEVPVVYLVEVPWLPVAEENGDVISNPFRCESIGIDMTCTYFVPLNRCQIDAPTVSMFTVECKGMEEYRRIITLVSSMAKNGCGSLKSYGPHHKVSVRGFRESVLCYVKSGFPRVYELPLEDIVLT